MNTIIKITSGFLLLAITINVSAQSEDRLKMKLNYNIGLPIGSFNSDYISNTSVNGGGGELSYWLNSGAAIGLQVGYQNYYQKYPRQTYKFPDNQTVSAVLTNTVTTMPVLINGTYLPLASTGKIIQPYMSGGAGINLVNNTQYYGEFSEGNSSASFAAQAGAGVMLGLGSKLNNAALDFGGVFNYMPYTKNGLKNLNNAGLHLGVVLPLR